MTAPAPDLDDILQRLEAALAELTEALKAADPERFDKDNVDGESVKRTIERTADDLNFYYGRLAARALNLPQPPCLSRAEFSSLREATVSLQVAHRRFSNLLHDLVPGDWTASPLKTTTPSTHCARSWRWPPRTTNCAHSR